MGRTIFPGLLCIAVDFVLCSSALSCICLAFPLLTCESDREGRASAFAEARPSSGMFFDLSIFR